MAMKPCRECATSVSTEAQTCPNCGVKSPTKKPTGKRNLLIGVGILIVLWAIGSGGGGSTPTSAASSAATPPTPPQRTAEERAADSTAAAARFAELARSFRFKGDEIEGGGWWSHTRQAGDNRKTLRANVAYDGRTYLEARYSAEDWIFVDHIIVKIGDQVLRSTPQPSYSDRVHRDNAGGRVWESIHMTGGIDNGILAAVAAADTATVKVRFQGDKYYSDIELSQAEKAAIRDAVELGTLLKEHPWLRRES